MAFKSSMEVRKLMKDLKLLELRDILIIRQVSTTFLHIQNKTVFKPDDLVLLKAVCTFSYETLASKPIFSENFCTEYISLILLLISTPTSDKTLGQYRQDLKTRLADEVL